MFKKSAQIYDALYSGKDYQAESQLLHSLIQKYKKSNGMKLLDIACGTGQHISSLKKYYDIEGLDLDSELLEIARDRNPKVSFHNADMLNFQLSDKFDAIICMFSSIGYVRTITNLHNCIANMTKHLCAGGVLVIEPWFTPSTYKSGLIHTSFVDQPELKIVRMNVSKIIDSISILDFHYLVATSEGVNYYNERHELGLFTDAEYKESLSGNALELYYDLYPFW